MKGETKKLYKLYTNPTFNLAFYWFSARCEMYSLCFKLYTNYTQNLTLNPTQRAFRTLHSERSRNYTRSGTQTIHFVFEHESREWNLERERCEWSGWCEWYEWDLEREWSEWCESYVTFVTNVTYVTNVKQEMAIGGDATRHSCKPQKIQQFWAIFRRFDINIFNLSEHFPPPNFAYSAHNFSFPSPNLNYRKAN